MNHSLHLSWDFKQNKYCLPVTASTSSSGVGALQTNPLIGEKGMLVFRFRPNMKLCTWAKEWSKEKFQLVDGPNDDQILILVNLAGATLSGVEQGRVTEERRKHPLNPAGLSGAMILLLCLLILGAT